LPAHITTAGRLRSWLKKTAGADAMLCFSREFLLLRSVDEELGNQFPDHLDWDDFSLALSYHFEPGHPADGVSVTVPVGLLNRIPRYRFEWLVPGLLREKCIALVKALPKALRKQLVPVPDYVDRALVEMQPENEPLLDVLSDRLRRLAGVAIALEDWPLAELDDYYRMNFRIVDAEGKLLRQGRDLERLIDESRDETRESLVGEQVTGPLATGLTRWNIDDIPPRWRTRQAGIEIESYPALVDRGESVDLCLLDYPQQAALAHRRGLTRLFRLQLAEQVRYLKKHLLRGNQSQLLLAGAAMERAPLLEDLVDAVFDKVFLQQHYDKLPRSREDFQAALQSGRGDLVTTANEYEKVLLNALQPAVTVRQRLAALDEHHHASRDIAVQLGALFAPGFLYDTPWEWYVHYPRYLKALANRLERMDAHPAKDRRHTETLASLTAPLDELLAQRPDELGLNPELQLYRWMLEELRVSFFAQALGTSLPVSVKRLAQQWEVVELWCREHPR
jgi:ATP-dependent helicase HrpA